MFIKLLYRTSIGEKIQKNFLFCNVRERKARESGKLEKNDEKINFFEVTSGKP